MKKKDKTSTIIIIILLLIILVLLLLGISLGRIEQLIPTGNVDVFIIDDDDHIKDDTNKASKNDDNKTAAEGRTWNTVFPNKNKSNNKEQQKKDDSDDEEEEEPIITEDPIVKDKAGEWTNIRTLNIFSNPAYQMSNKIAPGVSNVYNFVVYNSTARVLDYKMTMIEENPYQLNMKYRLKRNNQYIAGNATTWVYANEMVIEKDHMATNASDKYALEWKWVDNTNDTTIGKLSNATYTLKTSITFEESD